MVILLFNLIYLKRKNKKMLFLMNAGTVILKMWIIMNDNDTREVEITSEDVTFINEVPIDWDNDRVREELEDLFPIDEVKDKS